MKPSLESTFDVPRILLRAWWALVLSAAIGAGIAALYAMTAESWYRARISVVPSQASQDAGPHAGPLPVGPDAMFTAAQRIQAVLSSSSVADAVIEKFALERRYAVTSRDAARAELAKHCDASVERRSGIISLSCEDRDPRVAAEMAAYFGEVGNRVFGRISASSASEERKFLEAQLAKTRRDVDEASRKLREFQRAHKIVDLPEQSRAVISAMAAIKGELVSKQLELSYQSTFAAEDESSVTQLRRQIRILARKLRQLETSSGSTADFFPAATSLPAIRYELEQLTREQKIQETLFFVLTQRYETAKVDEARDTSTFQILDHPTAPAHPSRPQRTRMVMVGGFIGFAAACACTILVALWRRHRRAEDVV